MDHQDFKVVVLRKNKSPNNFISNQNNSSSKSSKSPPSESGDIVKPKTFTVDFGRSLASQRVQKNMSRKDLALKLNVKESIIGDIENGKHLYDGNIVHKLKRLFPSL